MHLQLLINSGGYARLNKLNEKQRQEIRNSRPKPREETSTRSPYKEVDPKRRRMESEVSPFKRPLDGKPPPQRTPKQRNRVDEWVEEQQGIKQNVQSITTEVLPSQYPRKGQGKRDEVVPKLVSSTREQGSQVEEEIPEPLRFVEEMMEERMKLPSMARETQTEEKEEIGMGKRVVSFLRHLPMDSPPSYTTQVRRSQGNEELRDDSYSKKEEISTGIRLEVIYSQKYISDEERMRELSIPGPVNLGHLPPPGMPKEDEYRELDRRQTHLKEKLREYPKGKDGNEKYEPPMKPRRKLTTDPVRTTNYPPSERKVIRQGIPQEQPKTIVPPEISTAEYFEALEQAKIIARKQGREDIQEVLQTVLRIRAQGKREFEKASSKQTAARGSSQRGAEPPRRPPDSAPGRGGAGGGRGRGEAMNLMNQMMLKIKGITLKRRMKWIQNQEKVVFENNCLKN